MAEKKEAGESSKKAVRPKYMRDPVFAGLAILCLALGMTTLYFAGGKSASPTGAAVAVPANDVVENTVDLGALKAKVNAFVTDNLLADSGMDLAIGDVNALGDGVYNMSYELSSGGQVQGAGNFIVLKNTLIIPQLMVDLDTPLPQPEAAPAPAEVAKSDRPEVQLFIMSFCPYGVQAASALNPVAGLLGDKADIKVGYVLYSNFASQYGADWSKYCSDESEAYCSMHGVGELNEDVRELCIQKYQGGKFWAYMAQVADAYNSGEVSASNIDQKWKGFAQAAGVDTAKVESCVAAEKDSLLAEQAALNAQYGVQGSPMMIVNGAEASFARSAEGFKAGICDAFNSAPGECGQTLSEGAAAAPTGGCG
jgi:hypothetical protein